MTLQEQVNSTLESARSSFEDDSRLVRLEEFYREMQRKGLIQRQKYSLPPVDTIGRTLCSKSGVNFSISDRVYLGGRTRAQLPEDSSLG